MNAFQKKKKTSNSEHFLVHLLATGLILYSSSSFGSRSVPWLGKGFSVCLVLSSAISCCSSICPGRLSTAWLVSLVISSCHYGLQVVTREVHRSSLWRLICPAQDHFTFLTVLIISMTFVLSLTQMLVFPFIEAVVLRKYLTFSISTLFTFIGVLSATITFVFAMFILRPIRLLSSDSSFCICCSSCGVSVHRNISPAKRRWERNSPSIFTRLFSPFNLLNMLSNVAVDSLGEMVTPCLTAFLSSG